MANFINPYNFIPFNSNVPVKNRERDADNLYTGSIVYRIKTRTPLIIPNTSNADIFGFNKSVSGHKSYEFFSYEDLSEINGNPNGKMPNAPVIPGSEIRGMFRSNYEIITDSCLPFLDSDQILHKRVSGFFRAGLIKKVSDNQYELIEAEDCLLRTKGADNLDTSDQDYEKKPENIEKYGRKSYIQSNLREGQLVYVTLVERKRGKWLVKKISSQELKNAQEGYIIKGMPGPEMEGLPQNKHCAHVFVEKDSEKRIKNVDIARLDDTLKMYGQNDEKAYKEYASEWKAFKKGAVGTYFPVYYSEIEDKDRKEKQVTYLSPASGTMETYKESIAKIVNQKCACKNKDKLCPACSLFGMLNDSGEGVASRVRFSDLRLSASDKENLYEEITTLQELSSPKLQNMEFYLKRPGENAQFWTYEYWVDTEGKLHIYDDEHQLKLNGRKFYWHTNNVAPGAKERNERNITTRPLRSGVEFIGEIYFEKITSKELNELIWLVNCGECDSLDNKKHGYKLGHAKPLGYGSIATSVDSVKIRALLKTNGKIDVEYLDNTEKAIIDSDKAFDNSDIKSNFEKMTEFEYLEKNAKGLGVSYPKVDGAEEVFKWFVANHGRHSQKREDVWDNKMPIARDEMVYGEYMEAMQPVLKTVHILRANNGGDGRTSSNRSNTERGNEFELNKTYEFKVIYHKNGRDNKPFYVVLELVSNPKIRISIPYTKLEKGFDATCVLVDSIYKLKYLGINNKNYPDWKKLNE